MFTVAKNKIFYRTKMHFVIDTVSEFTYFQNILLGLADSLHKCVGVKKTYVKKLSRLTSSEISVWEHTHGVALPEDFRSFYLSSNGYTFEWTYTFGDNSPEEQVIGKIEVNRLEDVNRVYGYETTNDPGVSIDNERYVLRLALESKIFELSLLPERGKVVLVYLYPEYIPTIWLLTTTMTFYFLADDLATYLRMAIAHLGIPNWQLAYTPPGLPQWTENIFRMIVPHLLPLNLSLEKMKREKRKHTDKDFPLVPLNKFDPKLFELLPRREASVEQQIIPVEPDFSKQIKKKPLSPLPQEQVHTVKSPKKFKRKPLYYIRKR